MKEEIILASASPRRRQLLEQIGISFCVIPSRKEEKAEGGTMGQLVEALARQKAEDIAAHKAHEKQLVLGADTIVVLDGKVLGKPGNEEEAVKMLNDLQGREHQVYTGVAFSRRQKDGSIHSNTFHEVTTVSVYPMSTEEIEAYVACKDCMDKAGAYGIQGPFAAYIKGISGDSYNVVGLPIGRVYQELKNDGV